MKKTLSIFLVLCIILSSCTAYNHTIQAPKNESLTPQDFGDIKVGQRVKVALPNRTFFMGRFGGVDDSSMIIGLENQPGNKTPYAVPFREIKKVHYQFDERAARQRTMGVVVMLLAGGFIYYVNALPQDR